MKRSLYTLLFVLMAVVIAQPARADWSWNELQKSATEKVGEIVVIAKTKWAEWMGDKAAERSVASEAPAAPAVSTTAGTPIDVTATSSTQVVTAPAHSITPALTPSLQTTDRKAFADLISANKKALDSKSVVQVAVPGRKAQTDLGKTKAGVPKFDMVRNKIKVTNIPKLDIGVEPTISKNDLVSPEMLVGFTAPEKAKELVSPLLLSKKEIDGFLKMKVEQITGFNGPDRSKFGLGDIVTQEKVDKITLVMADTKELGAEKPIAKVTANELKMLGALLLNKKGDKCHVVSGLFNDLSKDPTLAEEANYHLGICSHAMGLHSEAVKRLIKVVKSENPEYTPEAVATLVEDLPREYDSIVADAIKGIKNKALVTEKAKDHMNYVLARAAHAKGNYEEAKTAAAQVSEKSKLYPNARFILGITTYAMKKNREGQKVLEDLRNWMAKNGKSDNHLKALIGMNLARMMFVEKRFQAAHDEYMGVPKDHPLWVPALVEQGWTQLNIDDPAGAIGNMYSLHSPYFKSVFMPDSWVVRTIGYIDICQYGDAYRTLTKLEQLHQGHMTSINAYSEKNKTPDQYYTTVRNYIKGKSDQGVDGLPAQIIREIARQRGFLNVQDSMNGKEDEINQYKFIGGLLQKDQVALKSKMTMVRARIDKLNGDLKKAEKDPALAKFIIEWNAQKKNEYNSLKNYEFQVTLHEQARIGYNDMKATAYSRLDGEKVQLRGTAGKELMASLKELKSRLALTLEGNEFLRYEIFAGSGENIRYQVAGGGTSEGQRIPANVKPQKILNWEFDGEYWEDEIGSYRSTLTNNCPKNPRDAAGGVAKAN